MITTKIANIGMLEREFLELAGITKRTLKNWNKTGAPKWVHSMLELMEGNIKGCKGWNSCPGGIYDPDNNYYDLNEIRSLFFLRQMSRAHIKVENPCLACNDSIVCIENILELEIVESG